MYKNFFFYQESFIHCLFAVLIWILNTLNFLVFSPVLFHQMSSEMTTAECR